MQKLIVSIILWAITQIAVSQKLNFTAPIPSIFVPSSETGSSSVNKTRLTIAGTVNLGGPIYALGPMCSQGFQIAVDAIKKAALLDEFEVVVEPLDDMCVSHLGIRMMVDLLENKNESRNQPPLIVGPMCSEQTWVAALFPFYNHVGVAPLSVVEPIFANRRLYNSYFSIAPSPRISYIAMPHFFKSNGWSKVYLLSETVDFWQKLEQTLLLHLEKLNITLAGTSKIVAVTGVVPLPEHFEIAIKELKAMDPRIIVVNTNFGSLVACWLYKYQLYGPNYVFINFPGSYFLPNTKARYPGCTDAMLFEVLQSWFFHFFAAPVTSQGERVDSLGMSASRFEKIMKDTIDHPDLTSFWFHARYECYEIAVAAAVALDTAEKQLQENNDSLINWVTKTSNFQNNGSYIHGLLKKNFEDLKYQGLTARSSKPVNGLTGVSGFYQIQLGRKPSSAVSLSEAVIAVQVATFDSSDPNATVRFIAKQVWRTPDGNPPYDSIRIVLIKDPIISTIANGIVQAFAAILVTASTGLIVFLLLAKRSGSQTSEPPMTKFSIMILLGNILVCCFVFISPADGGASANVSCMIASLSLACGFYLLNGALYLKLQVAMLVLQKKVELQQGQSPKTALPTRRSSTLLSAVPRKQSFSAMTVMSQRGSYHKESFMTEESTLKLEQFFVKTLRRALYVPPVIALAQTLLMAIWFAIEPLKVAKQNRQFEASLTDLSLAYQHFAMACYLDTESRINLGFVAYFIATFALIFFRSASLAIVLRKASIKGLDDLHLIRISSYSTGISALAGGAVIWLFFRADPSFITLGSSVLVEIIVAIETAVIFIPKIRHRMDN